MKLVRSANINLLKAFAIVAVILLHSLSTRLLLLMGAPYHIWQAVPIFMILASYNGTKSYMRRGINTVRQGYEFNLLSQRFNRLLVPFILVWVAQVIITIIVLGKGLTTYDILKSFFGGGWGPGSYFIPVIIQHTLLLPLLYMLALSGLSRMLVILFVCDMAFELLSYALGLPSQLYRLLYFRYVFASALGIWLAMSKGVNKLWMMTGILISLTYISLVNYFNFKLPIDPSWGSQNAPSFIWPFSIVILGLKVLPKSATRIIEVISVKVGEASYHIFLTQMVYFWALGGLISSIPFYVKILLNIFVCISCGLAFYQLEYGVRNKILLIKKAST